KRRCQARILVRAAVAVSPRLGGADLRCCEIEISTCLLVEDVTLEEDRRPSVRKEATAAGLDSQACPQRGRFHAKETSRVRNSRFRQRYAPSCEIHLGLVRRRPSPRPPPLGRRSRGP